MRRLIDEAFAQATGILTARRELLEEGARQLLGQETLTEEELTPLAQRARLFGVNGASAIYG